MPRDSKKEFEMSKLSIEGKIRKDILDAALHSGKIGAHIAPSLSLVEIVIAILEDFQIGKDVFVLSKGHGALGYYAVMHQLNMISDEQFESFEVNGGEFPGQPSRTKNNHIDYSSGSLGMGLSYGVGRAWNNNETKVFVVLGDGELNEGSVWEAAALAAKLALTNIYAIVDCNGLQSDGQCKEILGLELDKIWKAYGWHVEICDGHSVKEIQNKLRARQKDCPTVILANTVKGKGISFMENNNEWHHNELKDEQYEMAVTELGEKYGFS